MKTFNFRIFALFSFIVFSWGLAWPINKIGLEYMSPLWYTTIRLFIAFIGMLGLVIGMKKLCLPKLKDLPLIATIGLLQIGIYILLTNIGLAYLPAGRSSLIAYTTPLWVMPIATIFFHEKSGLLRWLGFYVSLIGLFVFISPWELNWHDTNIIIGTGALLLASLCWGVSIVCVRYMHWSKSALELLPWQLLLGAFPVLLFACAKEPHLHVTWNAPLIASLIYTGIIVTGLSYWCGVIINKELPTVVISLGFLLAPVFSYTISLLFMHETINFINAIAIALILFGLMLVVAEKQSTS